MVDGCGSRSALKRLASPRPSSSRRGAGGASCGGWRWRPRWWRPRRCSPARPHRRQLMVTLPLQRQQLHAEQAAVAAVVHAVRIHLRRTLFPQLQPTVLRRRLFQPLQEPQRGRTGWPRWCCSSGSSGSTSGDSRKQFGCGAAEATQRWNPLDLRKCGILHQIRISNSITGRWRAHHFRHGSSSRQLERTVVEADRDCQSDEPAIYHI